MSEGNSRSEEQGCSSEKTRMVARQGKCHLERKQQRVAKSHDTLIQHVWQEQKREGRGSERV